MSRLIDADALKRKAQRVATESWKMGLTARIETTLNQFIDWIDNTPTVQPELDCALNEFGDCSYSETGCSDCKIKNKIRTALNVAQPKRWIYHPYYEHCGECAYECPICGMGSDCDYNFCMRCGTKLARAKKDI